MELSVAMNAVTRTKGELIPGEKIVLLTMLTIMEERKVDRLQVSADAFSSYCQMSARTFQRHIKGLKAKGMLTWDQGHGPKGMKLANTYTITFYEA